MAADTPYTVCGRTPMMYIHSDPESVSAPLKEEANVFKTQSFITASI